MRKGIKENESGQRGQRGCGQIDGGERTRQRQKEEKKKVGCNK